MMFRIFGFLIGSAGAIGVILWMLGMPELRFEDQQATQQRFDAALDKLRAKQMDTKLVVEEISSKAAVVSNSVQETVETATKELSIAPEDNITAPNNSTVDTDSPEQQAQVSDEFTADNEGPLQVGDAQWYSFWNPFRSEIAAKGFVSQLERVTGLDYRVVKVKPGVYEVAFAYEDDVERRTKLSQISASTGLDLPQQ